MKALFFIEVPTHQPTDESVYNWYKKEQDNDCNGCDSLINIKEQSLNCEIILVLPGFNVTQKQVTSKLRNRKKLEMAIAYQLEEVLSEEIENLFFAYQATKEKNIIDVAVVNRVWFEKWLDVFNRQDILLTAVITDSMLLKNSQQEYFLIKKSDFYLLKTPAENYVIDSENISYFLNQLKSSLPEELTLITDNTESLIISEIPLSLKVLPIQDSVLKLLCQYYNLENSVNLLQGNYKPKLKNDWQKIKWASIGLFSLLLLATAFQGYQHWQLTKQETKLDQQRLKIFQDNFPAVKRIVNPLAQMKNQLEVLMQSQQQQSQFIGLLAKVAIALKDLIAQEKIHLLGLEFDSNVLIIKLSANSLALIDQIKQSLAQQQLNVEIAASDKVEDQVNASFKISGL
jgi:general secretion pathway protein L